MSTYLRVLSKLRELGEAITVPELAEALHLSVGTVRLAVKDLLESGRVQKLGISSTNARCYGITTKGREALAAHNANR